jgi:endonuclease/exonuclease/phosphatase family metal-dependent hydrolase
MNAIATRKSAVVLLLVAVVLLLVLLFRPRYGLRVADLRPAWRPPASVPSTPASPPLSLRVATYNLEHFTDAHRDGPDRTPAVLNLHATGAAASLVEANPDIAVFQEVENAAALRALNSRLPSPYPFAYVTAFRHGSGRPDKLNHALLSRIPPSVVRQISFTRLLPSLYATRGALAATFSLSPTLDLLVYDLHLKSNFGDAPAVHAQRQIASTSWPPTPPPRPPRPS